MGACAPSTLVCSRCQAHGHLAKDCKSKPFLRLCSLAEEREQRQLAAAQRRKEWEVERLASKDKNVRKLTKKLQEISKLEGLRDLDVLQVAKVARKREVEVEYETALGLAIARTRNELRGRGAA